MFPYCQPCVAHVAAWDSTSGCGLIALALIVAVVLGIAMHPLAGLVAGVGGVAYAARTTSARRKQATQMCSPECACAQRAVTYVGWSGTVETFDIMSEPYALRFMRSNLSKLVNVSPEILTKLHSASAVSVGSTQPVNPLPTPQAPPVQPSRRRGDAALLFWIEKIESAKGPAARRAALELALQDAELHERREEFIKAAAQVEVRATLDKVDTLKMDSAKRRHLVDALNALRADSAPDELQDAAIQRLEAALAELETKPS